MMQITKKILTYGLCALGTTPAFADDEHYVNFLLGGRAMGMGGAYTAVSDDPAGMYYNPAGIVYAHSPNLSASVNAFKYSNKTFLNVFSGGEDWNRDNSALVPNFFGVTQPFSNFTVGFSYAVPDIAEENQTGDAYNLTAKAKDESGADITVNVEKYINTLHYANAVNAFGPSIAYQASDSFAIGMTLYFHKKDTRTIFFQNTKLESNSDADYVKNSDNTIDTTDTNNTVEEKYQYQTNSEYGVMPILGIMWSPTDKLALGASYRQVFALFSDGYYLNSCLSSYLTTQSDLCDKTTDEAKISSGTTSNTHGEYPFELRFGGAYFASNSLLLSGDVTYNSEVAGKLATINFAGGAEYYATPEWAIRAGGYTNFSNAPTPKASNSNEHIDYFGGAFSVTRFSKNSSISAGTNIMYGTGTSSSVAGGKVTDVSAFDMTFFLSTAYSY